jgi:glycosyltransferase involved in cell wall biosynthesis
VPARSADTPTETAILDAPAARVESRAAQPRERMLIVIPAYNEQGRLKRVVEDVHRSLPHADVLVVDDGSSDGTAKEALAAGARLLSLPVNLGYGAALQAGYKYAVRRGYPLVGQIDADGQHKAEHFGALLEHLGNHDVDVVIGSRFLDGDGHYRPARARKLGMALFGSIASAVTRQSVSDPTSGFQVMRGSVAQFFCSEVYPTDYPDADILILLHRSGFKIGEVGVQMRAPSSKSMHSGHRSLYYVYKMSLSIFVTLLRRGVHKGS